MTFSHGTKSFKIKSPSFEFYMLRRTGSIYLSFSILMYIFVSTFLITTPDIILQTILLSLCLTVLFMGAIVPAGNRIATYRLSCRISLWESVQMSDSERKELLEDLHRYPRKKTFNTFFCFTILLLIILADYIVFFDVDIIACLPLFLIGSTISYCVASCVYDITDAECTALGITITKQGIPVAPGNKIYSVPLRKIHLFYIVIPLLILAANVFFTATFGTLSIHIHENGSLASLAHDAGLGIKTVSPSNHTVFRMIFTIIITIICIIIMIKLFYKKILLNLSRMENTLSLINPQNINQASLFDVALNNEISYTMFLINKTIIAFRNIMNRTQAINGKIKESSKDLVRITKETEETLYTQTSCVEEILATMNSTDSVSTAIQVRLDEVTNVAHQTLNDVNKNFENFNESLLKMKEITETNQTIINGIKKLSSKVDGIWDIVNIIDSMTEQTKIIAFNAELVSNSLDDSNFKNVAAEIRALADNVIDLTKQIRDKILEIQNSSSSLINSGKEYMKQIEEGNTLSELLKEHFISIKKSASITAEDSNDIKNAVQTQTSAFRLILKSMTDIFESLKSFTSNAANIGTTIEILQHNSQHIESLLTQEAQNDA